MRDVMMHTSWVPKHVLAAAGWKALGQEHLAANSLELFNDLELQQLWTATQTEVRPSWPDMTTVDTPPQLEETLSSAATATAAAEKTQEPPATSASTLV
ncbi:hypothetical protein LZ30DRAFT_275578 [Colletotrichum cereale]|nr:hypothetical protein LZ30DRAFT_275578 [Colletotrichum cereale]